MTADFAGATQLNPLNPALLPYQDDNQRRALGCLHKSEHKVTKGRGIFNLPDAHQDKSQMMSSGLVAVNQFQATVGDINISEADSPVKVRGTQGARSKSHNNYGGYTGCVASAELQAHMDKLRLRQQQQALSPYQNSNKQHPHFESLYHLQYPQLSPI